MCVRRREFFQRLCLLVRFADDDWLKRKIPDASTINRQGSARRGRNAWRGPRSRRRAGRRRRDRLRHWSLDNCGSLRNEPAGDDRRNGSPREASRRRRRFSTSGPSGPDEVRALIGRITREQGALHILVNDIWGATRMEWNKPVWDSDLDYGLRTLRLAVDNTQSRVISPCHY